MIRPEQGCPGESRDSAPQPPPPFNIRTADMRRRRGWFRDVNQRIQQKRLRQFSQTAIRISSNRYQKQAALRGYIHGRRGRRKKIWLDDVQRSEHDGRRSWKTCRGLTEMHGGDAHAHLHRPGSDGDGTDADDDGIAYR